MSPLKFVDPLPTPPGNGWVHTPGAVLDTRTAGRRPRGSSLELLDRRALDALGRVVAALRQS